jgi:hypothetical protein
MKRMCHLKILTGTGSEYLLTCNWYYATNEYACRHLTVQNDRFPTLSGLAQVLAQGTHLTYKCGIWLEDIRRGLLRFPRGQNRTLKKSSDVGAPSWSWASIDWAGGTVTPHHPLAFQVSLRASDATLIKCDVDMADSDPYGRILSAGLTIKGQCRAVSRRHERELTPIYNYTININSIYDSVKPRLYILRHGWKWRWI